MKKNTCLGERIIRIVVGLAIASLAFWGPHNQWFLLGLIPVVIGIVGWCPLYTLFGIDRSACCKTACCCKRKNKDAPPPQA